MIDQSIKMVSDHRAESLHEAVLLVEWLRKITWSELYFDFVISSHVDDDLINEN